MVEDKIDISFIEHVCDWFGRSQSTLSTSGIRRFCNKYAVRYNVNLENATHGKKFQNKASCFVENMIQFNAEQQYAMIMELCNMHPFSDEVETKEILSTLIKRYGHFAPDLSAELDNKLINETRHFLDSYPDAKEAYENALSKYNADSFGRNLVDDLRFAYEVLLKNVFENDKPLEKQFNEINEFLSSEGFPDEFITMYNNIRREYCTFQNRCAKHNDKVDESQYEFLIELTSSLMKLIARKH